MSIRIYPPYRNMLYQETLDFHIRDVISLFDSLFTSFDIVC